MCVSFDCKYLHCSLSYLHGMVFGLAASHTQRHQDSTSQLQTSTPLLPVGVPPELWVKNIITTKIHLDLPRAYKERGHATHYIVGNFRGYKINVHGFC